MSVESVLPGGPGDVPDLLASAQGVLAAPHAENTTSSYDSDWRRFVAWCTARDVRPLPAEPGTVVAYLMDAMGAGLAGNPVQVRALVHIGSNNNQGGCLFHFDQ